MGKVISLRGETLRNKDPGRDEFLDLLDSIEQMIEDLRSRRKMQDKLTEALGYIKEMKLCGMLSQPFRVENYWQLDELADQLYEELHGDDNG